MIFFCNIKASLSNSPRTTTAHRIDRTALRTDEKNGFTAFIFLPPRPHLREAISAGIASGASAPEGASPSGGGESQEGTEGTSATGQEEPEGTPATGQEEPEGTPATGQAEAWPDPPA